MVSIKGKKTTSLWLKIALFATGLAGIVAEYTLSTLASYFLGDSIIQWALIVSFMLFSMGVGSRLSRLIKHNLLEAFIICELVLSVICSLSGIISYSAAGFTEFIYAIIYGQSILIGLLIGMEIPIVIRMNESYESLRINISSALEKDYYGSLAGGVFFAFIGIPVITLTYTPFVVGAINLLVAFLLLGILATQIAKRNKLILMLASSVVALIIAGAALFAEPIIQFAEQSKYRDKIIYSEQSRYQKLVVTQWKEHFWLYLNGNLQLSTYDEHLYHEPLVHTAMAAFPHQVQQVLILGGGDGCAARELLKHPHPPQITIVDLDPAVTSLGKEHEVLVAANDSSLFHPKVEIINLDGFRFLEDAPHLYDVIIIDLPDPKGVEINRLYTKEFYHLCYQSMSASGALITQAGSPYYATEGFNCINYTMQASGFNTIPLHNQVPSMGEWGWILGSKSSQLNLHNKLLEYDYEALNTRWLNKNGIRQITSFGKGILDSADVNTMSNPILYRMYLKGDWDKY